MKFFKSIGSPGAVLNNFTFEVIEKLETGVCSLSKDKTHAFGFPFGFGFVSGSGNSNIALYSKLSTVAWGDV
ncbi:hypothetical protein JCM19274_470 [Algibacter lectus]|uniref:Uncharacterized protein n=1 Tax=Algibacter lectus TaxID=221126 RepID=A0A090WWX1_9FLAO|nr:hypothetical protein JCM19274_470 [Algibacter lectus]